MTSMDFYLCNNGSESLEHMLNFPIVWLGCQFNLAARSLLLFIFIFFLGERKWLDGGQSMWLFYLDVTIVAS